METISRLEITGCQGISLGNTFYQTSPQARRLAILLPGRGYSCAMPVLFYPARWFSSRGADVLTIEYGFSQPGQAMPALGGEDLLHWLGADAAAALQAGLRAGDYTEVVLVGKSIGTLALSQLLSALPSGPAFSFLWLTPLFKHPALREALLRTRPRSLFVQGTGDPHYDPHWFAEMRTACAAQALLIPDADHSLEFGGDFPAAFAALQNLLAELSAFTGW